MKASKKVAIVMGLGAVALLACEPAQAGGRTHFSASIRLPGVTLRLGNHAGRLPIRGPGGMYHGGMRRAQPRVHRPTVTTSSSVTRAVSTTLRPNGTWTTTRTMVRRRSTTVTGRTLTTRRAHVGSHRPVGPQRPWYFTPIDRYPRAGGRTMWRTATFGRRAGNFGW